MNQTVLIVDDSKIERTILSDLLKKDYNILAASSGKEALTLLKREHASISVVLLDIIMPGMDGYTVLQEVRSNVDYSKIPVIITTSMTEEEARETSIIYGASGFIRKPYNRTLLLRSIQNVIKLRETADLYAVLRRDRLTGLLKRESFFSEAERMIKRRESGYYTLSCIDVDHFRVINDQYGIEQGDAVLKYIATCMNDYFAGIKGLVCRIMADKFAVLYPSAMQESKGIQKIHQKIMSPHCINRSIHIRIGRYLVDDFSLSVSAMFDRAALAEKSIKGRYDAYIADYSDALRENLLQEQQIVNEMTGALQNGAFEPWFQPQFNHATGAMIGAEALVRWRRNGTLVPPNVFIPIFEHNGFIYQLDQYMWRQVCLLLRRWLDEGKQPLPISVNISRYDMFQSDFLATISGLVKEFKLPTDLLRLEVTESAFAESTKTIIHTVNELIKYGFTVEIDDFGSGYSSLNTLKDVPASILKLDMRFFENTENSQRSGSIIESVTRMAKWLGMAIIAEGVEDKERADFLRSIGCYYIQGYYYAKPMPLEEYEALWNASVIEPKLSRLNAVDMWDNSTFWDPRSMETLIFNSYVGGACIFEFCQGTMELLRTNEQYAVELGNLTPGSAQISEKDPVRYLDEENKNTLYTNIRNAIQTRRESTCELKLSDGGTPEHIEYIRSTVRVIANVGERFLVYCVIVNITKQRELSDQLRAVVENINGGVSATYLQDGKPVYIIVNKKYYDVIGYTEEQFNAEVPNVFALIHPEDREEIKARFQAESNRCGQYTMEYRIIRRDGAVRNILCNTSVLHMSGVDELVQLAVSSDITELREAQKKETEISQRMDTIAYSLMNDTPGGFVRMKVSETNVITPVYFNQGFQNMVGMDHDTLMVLYDKDVFTGVHPEDLHHAHAFIDQLLLSGKARSTRYRIRNGSGGYTWVAPTGKAMREDTGGTYLNVYYTDATEQMEEEQKQRDLLDHLPCGASLFEYNGKTITVNHINKKYWELVGRASTDYSAALVFDKVHPDDRLLLQHELEAAIRQNRDFSCDARIQFGESEYRPFHIMASIMEKSHGRYALFASYTPISERVMSIQEMLPVALSTMMSTSGDYSFVKDKDLRYICCSRAVVEINGLNSMQDIIGKTDSELHNSIIAKQFERIEKKLLETGEPLINVSAKMYLRTGEERYVDVSLYPIMDASGQIIGEYCFSRDVTAQLEKEANLDRLINSIPGGLATYECTPSRIRITYCNTAFVDLFGTTRDACLNAQNIDAREFVYREDQDEFLSKYNALMENGTPMDITYRASNQKGGLRWIHQICLITAKRNDTILINSTLLDITEQMKNAERLRISEEVNRLAIEQSGNIITRFDVQARTLTLPGSFDPMFDLPPVLEHVPEEQISSGRVSPETAAVYTELFESIVRGSATGTATYQQKSTKGWRWLEAHYTTVFSTDGHPISAVISFTDITEQLEKEVVYKKWQQSLKKRPEDSFTLLRCNLSQNMLYNSWEGNLLNEPFHQNKIAFRAWTAEYVKHRVFEKDKKEYAAFLDLNALQSMFHHGQHSDYIEFREMDEEHDMRWLRLSVDLVEYPNSKDIEMYLLFENIDEQKKAALLTQERSETDPLTGVLNRSTFVIQMEQVLQASKPGEIHALLMLDIDDFKNVNDTYGHATGDKVLKELTKGISSHLRKSDLVGRAGGDEFFVFVKGIPSKEIAAMKAKQICGLHVQPRDADTPVTVSIGIALVPEDGTDFDTLYQNADDALYKEKKQGKNGYCFRMD